MFFSTTLEVFDFVQGMRDHIIDSFSHLGLCVLGQGGWGGGAWRSVCLEGVCTYKGCA